MTIETLTEPVASYESWPYLACAVLFGSAAYVYCRVSRQPARVSKAKRVLAFIAACSALFISTLGLAHTTIKESSARHQNATAVSERFESHYGFELVDGLPNRPGIERGTTFEVWDGTTVHEVYLQTLGGELVLMKDGSRFTPSISEDVAP